MPSKRVGPSASIKIPIDIYFSRGVPRPERRSEALAAKGERGICQRRLWKHAIRDNRDYAHHMDYVHFNPVKHGLVASVTDRPHSTFHRCVTEGLYPRDRGGEGETSFCRSSAVPPQAFAPAMRPPLLWYTRTTLFFWAFFNAIDCALIQPL